LAQGSQGLRLCALLPLLVRVLYLVRRRYEKQAHPAPS